MVRKLMIVLASMTAALILLPSAAFAQSDEYPPSSGDLTVDSGTAAAGGSVEIAGGGCMADSDVALAVDGTDAGSTTADSNGDFSAEVEIPDTASGTVEVTATCTGEDNEVRVLSASITVSDEDEAAPLPRTGSSDSFPMAAVALVLLSVGVAIVVATRRRATAKATAE